MSLFALTAAAVLGALALSSCAMADGRSADLASPSAPSATSAGSTPAATGPASVTAPSVAKFGGSYTWSDGLKVTTSALTTFTPNEMAFGLGVAEQGVKVTLTVTNGTRQTFDPARTSLTLTYGPDGVEVDRVTDLDNNVRGSSGLPRQIPPGKSGAATFGFSVRPDALEGLYAQVSLGVPQHKPAIFTGSAT